MMIMKNKIIQKWLDDYEKINNLKSAGILNLINIVGT